MDYQSRVKPPSEYEHAYEQERGRWLRRRLMWYAGVSLAFGLLLSLPALFLKNEVSGADVVSILVSNAAAACMLVLAWRCRPHARSVLRIAFIFYVLASFWSIGYSYLTFASQTSAFRDGLEEGFVAGNNAAKARLDELAAPAAPDAPATAPSTAPSTGPISIEGDPTHADGPLTINLGGTKIRTSGGALRDNVVHGVLYSTLLFSFFVNHLIVCLFIPWTVRESLRPAGLIAGAAIAVTAINVLFGFAVWWLLVGMMLLIPLVFVPGTLVCWWRYSRFQKRFRLQFESGRYRLLQHELNSAREVHDANLPAPRLAGPVRLTYTYEPMRQIGGDLLMIYPQDPNLPPQFVILFDVTGHGVAAALSVNRIVGEIERLLAENPDESVERLARALNRYIHLTLARHHLYVSALLFQVDRDRNLVRCVNAGHPTAYHVAAATRKVREIESTSMLLGVVGDADFELESISLAFQPGDAIVGYTDGASEAANLDERMLGVTGVREAIRKAASESSDPGFWPSIVSTDVIRHRQTPPQDDTIIFSLWRV